MTVSDEGQGICRRDGTGRRGHFDGSFTVLSRPAVTAVTVPAKYPDKPITGDHNKWELQVWCRQKPIHLLFFLTVFGPIDYGPP